MPQLPLTHTGQRPRKICVVGSMQHNGVTCVEWEDASDVNLIDFDVVIANVETLPPHCWQDVFGKPVREALSALVASGGFLIVLGQKKMRNSERIADSNYCWCPIYLDTVEDTGDTVELKTENDLLTKFLSHLKRWTFYYDDFQPTIELVTACGGDYDWPVRLVAEPFAINRYKKMLAGAVVPQRYNKHVTETQPTQFGVVGLLPSISQKNNRESVNIFLNDVLQIPQQSIAPKWVDTIVVPQSVGIQAAIDEYKAQIEKLTESITRHETKKKELNDYKQLLYADGKELENIFARCLRELGGTVEPAKYAQEEYVLIYKGKPYLIECKGNKKSIGLTDLRQLSDYLNEFEDSNNKPGKGILFGNAWKELPPQERGTESTIIFPDNVKRRVSSFEISLVNSVDFFYAFLSFLSGEITGERILRQLTATTGVVDFSK
jgi:hypothetical protein